MNKNFSLVLMASIFLFFFETLSMDFYIIGETSHEELVNEGIKHLKTYLSVMKEFSEKKDERSQSRFNKRKHHVYISSSEDIYLEQLTQSEE